MKASGLTQAEVNSLISIGIGNFLPLIVAFANQRKWPDFVKVFVGLLFAFFAALLQLALQENVGTWPLLKSFAFICIAYQASYQSVWKHLGIKKLEEATSLHSGKRDVKNS